MDPSSQHVQHRGSHFTIIIFLIIAGTAALLGAIAVIYLFTHR